VSTENSERVFPILASDAAAAISHLKNDYRIASDRIIVIGGSQAGWIIPEINAIANVWLSVCISGPLVSVGEEIYYSELAENGAYAQEQADQMLRNFRGLRGYDPIARTRKMNNPSLWIFGGKDVSIPVKRCIHLFDSIRRSQQHPISMKLYPHADHGLYTEGKREDYVNLIIQWIKNHR
jgi:dipeptidyl aminopeptidase/acylaminoacyl peptidase